MDSKLGDTVAHRLHVAEKTSFKPLDPRDHNATNRGVCKLVKPRGEFRERFDAEHVSSVIERLHIVKPESCPTRCERSNRPTAANRAEETLRVPRAVVVAKWMAAPLKTDQAMVRNARV